MTREPWTPWTVRDGPIVRFQAYIDTPAMLAALGEAARHAAVIPPPA